MTKSELKTMIKEMLREELSKESMNEGIFDSKAKKQKDYDTLIKQVFNEDTNSIYLDVVDNCDNLLREIADTVGEDSNSKNLGKNIITMIKNARATINKTPQSLVKNIISLGTKYEPNSTYLEELENFIPKVGKLQTAGKQGYKAMEYLFGKVNTELNKRLNDTIDFLSQEFGLIK